MSLSNNPLRPSTGVPTTEKTLTDKPSTESIKTGTTPSVSNPGVSNPEAFKSKTSGPSVSTLPDTGQIVDTEKVVEQTPKTKLDKLSRIVPKPTAMTQSVSVFSEQPQQTPKSETGSLSKQDFGQLLIRPNFARLCKELDRTIFTKGKVINRAQERGKLIAGMTPPGSDLMRTFMGASDAQLRDMVSHGIALTKPGKYGPDTSYEQLSRNKRRMVDAIVAGIRQGLPKDLESLRQVEGKGDPGQVQVRMDLNEQIRNAKLKPPSQETLDALDRYVDEKGIKAIREGMQHDIEALRTKLTYDDLPVPDPAETSLDVLGNDRLKALLPVDDTLKARALQALGQVPESDRSGLLWTLGMKPFNQTCDDVSQRLFGKALGDLDENQTRQVGSVAQALVVASLEKLGPGEGNSLVRSGNDGPQEVTHNGKTYERVRKLGEGGFGVAFLFKERGGSDEIVVKRFKSNGMDDEKWFGAMQDEIRTHRYAMGPDGKGHENVLGLRGIITRPPNPSEDEHFGELFTVTEVAKGGELRGVMKTLHEELQAGRISKSVHDLLNRQIFAQTIEGMHYVQKDRQMLHLDLKPENLFMTEDGQVKVGDFGLANIGHFKKNPGGTMVYLSPEAVKGTGVDYHGDTWTLGIIGRELFTGTRALPENGVIPKQDAPGMYGPMFKLHAFAGNPDNRVYQSEQDGGQTTVFEGPDGVERPLQNLGGFHQLINGMQHPDPSKRPTLDVVREHEFVSDPILKSEPLQQLLGKLCMPTGGLSPQQLQARSEAIVRLNGEVESLAKR